MKSDRKYRKQVSRLVYGVKRLFWNIGEPNIIDPEWDNEIRVEVERELVNGTMPLHIPKKIFNRLNIAVN